MYLCMSARRQPALQLKKHCPVVPGTFALIHVPKIDYDTIENTSSKRLFCTNGLKNYISP